MMTTVKDEVVLAARQGRGGRGGWEGGFLAKGTISAGQWSQEGRAGRAEGEKFTGQGQGQVGGVGQGLGPGVCACVRL